MATNYSVIQYLPNPLADERMNVGVVVYDETHVRARFVADWKRLRNFANEDLQFLKSFAADFQRKAKTLQPLTGDDSTDVAPSELRSMITNWIHSIQFTTPRASLSPAAELLLELETRYLSTPRRVPAVAYRDREAARAVAKRGVRLGLQNVVDPSTADGLIRERGTLEGQFDKHIFDTVVSNGRPYFAVQAISFEMPDTSTLRRTIDATAWRVDDVHSLNPELPLGVLMLLPEQISMGFGRAHDMMERAKRVFESIGADVFVEEKTVLEWSEKVARRTVTLHQHELRSL
jgi:hypothetical protein